jgi:hypothetical protein
LPIAASIYNCQHCLGIGVWMGNGYDVKMTVLRGFDPAEVFEKSPVTLEQPIRACGLFKDFRLTNIA